MYTIIHFIDENSVEVVPSMWVKTSNNGTSNCFWPPKHTFKGQALTKALESCIAPDMQWDMYSAEILKVTGTVFTLIEPPGFYLIFTLKPGLH